jgi:hypothetical protein
MEDDRLQLVKNGRIIALIDMKVACLKYVSETFTFRNR